MSSPAFALLRKGKSDGAVLPATIVVLLAAACSNGAAIPRIACPGTQIACGQRCLDVTSDPANCGGCGIPCAADQTCAGGACQCPDGLVDCNGSCVVPAASSAACLVPAPATLVTSAPDDYWNTTGVPIEVPSGNADVVVDDATTAQTWEGFGGAFNELGWSYLSMLGADDRDRALQLLFGADGARFAFGRIPIGASDYALDRYTDDEVPSGMSDYDLAAFSIERDLGSLIPYVKAAQAIKPNIRLWASPWTPPTWMKQGPFSNGNLLTPFDGGTMRSDDATLESYAQYLIRFVQAYDQQGISIEAISAQNEPSYTGTYPTCGWSPETYTTFVGRHLGPAIAAAGLGTRILLGTFNGGGSDPDIVNSVLGDAGARGSISVLGYQWGMESHVGAAKAYDLPIWQTEHKCGNYPWQAPFDASAAPNDQAYAVESWGLIRDWIRAGATAYSAWNMVLDVAGIGIDSTRVWPQDALLVVDTAAGTLTATPAYYVFRHISQFVSPGAKVVKVSGGDAIAFENPDGSLVVVVHQAGAASTLTVMAGGKGFQFRMPADGWATLVLR